MVLLHLKKVPKVALMWITESGKIYHADVVILAIGVRPDTTLAKMAGSGDWRTWRNSCG